MKLNIIENDKKFKTDSIKNGRLIKKFCRTLAKNVFLQSYTFYDHKQKIDKNFGGEIPLTYFERNIYSSFSVAINKITPVHLSEWSFNKKDNSSLKSSRRVDFWCLDKSSSSGKAINYFIEVKKGWYCLNRTNRTSSGKLTKRVASSIKSLQKQTSVVRRLSPNWDGADDVYLGVMIIHGYFQKGKYHYNHDDLQKEILSQIDKRHCAQVYFSTWNLPDGIINEKPWINADQCRFISLAMFAVTRTSIAS